MQPTMKILVICQHYWPEPYPLTDVCEELAKRGHQVDLVTDIPNYPMGEIYPAYKQHQRRIEEHNGVHITRTYTIPRHHNAVFRLLNYYSYAFSSTFYTKHMKEEYDVVFANQTSPVMMSTAAFAYAKKHGKKVVMYCMDLWPASLAAGGLSENSPVYWFFGWVSGRLYRKADRILITSQMFRDYLTKQHHVENVRVDYLPQYADARFDEVASSPSNKETVDLMFAGNVGAAQNLTIVIEAAHILKNETNLRWHIVGDGSELENLKAQVQSLNLDNVIFHGRRPIEEMPQYYAMADAMIVTLIADPFISLTLPGKVQTYMAAGKPIIGAATGEIPRVIAAAQCGYCSDAEDARGLAKNVQAFLKCEDKQKLGENAKAYYRQCFTRDQFMDKLERELIEFSETKSIRKEGEQYVGV